MSKILIVLGLVFTAFSFSSCGDDKFEDPDYENAKILPYAIYETYGSVKDETGKPLKDIEVKLVAMCEIIEKGKNVIKSVDLENGIATTNENGEFSISCVYTHTYALYLTKFRVIATDPSGVYKSNSSDYDSRYIISFEGEPELDEEQYDWLGRYNFNADITLTN